MAHNSPQQINTWKERIAEWQSSNSSMAQWCRSHAIPYHQFSYWKQRLEIANTSKQSNFTELSDTPEDECGFVIECQDLRLRPSRNFDEKALVRCLQLMRKAAC